MHMTTAMSLFGQIIKTEDLKRYSIVMKIMAFYCTHTTVSPAKLYSFVIATLLEVFVVRGEGEDKLDETGIVTVDFPCLKKEQA